MAAAGGGMAATVLRFLPRAPLMNSEACQLSSLGKVTAVGWRAMPYVPLANAVSHRERVFMMSKPGMETREQQRECYDSKKPKSPGKMEVQPQTGEGLSHSPSSSQAPCKSG